MKKAMVKRLIFATILCCLFFALLFIMYNKTTEPIVFKHDKIYNEYKNLNKISGRPLEPTYEKNKESQVLTETESFEIKYAFPENFNSGGFVLDITNKISDETTSLEFVRFNVDDKNYDIVTGDGYYNPYSGKYEDSIFFEENGDSEFTVSILCMSDIFLSETVIPNVMTENDYMQVLSLLSEKNDEIAYNKFQNYYLEYDQSKEAQWGLFEASRFLSEDKTSDNIRVLKPYSGVPFYLDLDDKMVGLGFTVEEKRQLEYKVLSDIEADMAIFHLTFRIEDSIPKLEITYDIISPKENQSANMEYKADFYNEMISKVFSK